MLCNVLSRIVIAFEYFSWRFHIEEESKHSYLFFIIKEISLSVYLSFLLCSKFCTTFYVNYKVLDLNTLQIKTLLGGNKIQ